VEFDFELGAVDEEKSPGIVPEMGTSDQPDGACDLVGI